MSVSQETCVCRGGRTPLFLKFLKPLTDIFLSSKDELSHLLPLVADCVCSVLSDDGLSGTGPKSDF